MLSVPVPKSTSRLQTKSDIVVAEIVVLAVTLVVTANHKIFVDKIKQNMSVQWY